MIELLLKPIDTTKLLTVIGLIAVISIVLTVLIIIVSKVCKVETDERVEKVKENLAGANCGGCGFAGCADFAKALVEGKTTLDACGATANESKAEIAKLLGLEYSSSVSKFAVVKCAGGNVCKDKFEYVGNTDCVAQNSYMGGKKVCSSACLGGGSCINVCPHGSIKIENGVAVVDLSNCGGCGGCVIKCPKNIIELIPTTAKVYVACSSECKGKQVMDACKVGCIGCGLCAKNCPENAIQMVNNLPVIDYSKCTGCLTCVTKCPRKTIKII